MILARDNAKVNYTEKLLAEKQNHCMTQSDFVVCKVQEWLCRKNLTKCGRMDRESLDF